ncbi:MAG: preprotein translocase subunit SecE [Christensenellales bacterium]
MANTTSKEKKKGRIKGFFKETKSEIKKVSWPTIGKVTAQTGVVIVVVLFFLLVIFLFDSGLSALLKLLTA